MGSEQQKPTKSTPVKQNEILNQRHSSKPKFKDRTKKKTSSSSSSSHLFPQRLDASRPSRANAQAASRTAIKSKYGAPIGRRYDATGTPIDSQYMAMLGSVLKDKSGTRNSNSSSKSFTQNEAVKQRQPPSGPIRSRDRDKNLTPGTDSERFSLSSALANTIRDSQQHESKSATTTKKLPSSARRRLQQENKNKEQNIPKDEKVKHQDSVKGSNLTSPSHITPNMKESQKHNFDNTDEKEDDQEDSEEDSQLEWENVGEEDDSEEDAEFEDILDMNYDHEQSDENDSDDEDEKARRKRHELAVEAYKAQAKEVSEKLTIVLGPNNANEARGSDQASVSSRFIRPDLSNSKQTKKRGATTLSKEEKKERLAIHKLHLICLLGHVRVRNAWCNDPSVLDKLRKLLPKSIRKELKPNYKKVRKYNQETQDLMLSRTLLDGLRHAMVYWNDHLFNTAKERGMKNVSWSDIYKKVSFKRSICFGCLFKIEMKSKQKLIKKISHIGSNC